MMDEYEKLVTCPKCGVSDEHPPAFRQHATEGILVVECGWRCNSCGHEWGFEEI